MANPLTPDVVEAIIKFADRYRLQEAQDIATELMVAEDYDVDLATAECDEIVGYLTWRLIDGYTR